MHEAFDPEPVRELSADEAPTPLWLTAVGVALLLAVGGALLVSAGDSKEGAAGSSSAAAAAASASAGGAQVEGRQ
ncbi:MAG: hypothetical protein FJ096_22635 [Deltaproteobacteria bacterium]|nr:hypothetical protein [Deltaproteobacteria bacterium]